MGFSFDLRNNHLSLNMKTFISLTCLSLVACSPGGGYHSRTRTAPAPTKNIMEGTGMYLRHPGDEEEEKEESPDHEVEEESREGFASFVQSHQAKTKEKIKAAATN